MKALNLRKLQEKTREKRKRNQKRLSQASDKLAKYKHLDVKLTALELLLDSLLDGTPGLTQQLEKALKDLEEQNKKDGAW